MLTCLRWLLALQPLELQPNVDPAAYPAAPTPHLLPSRASHPDLQAHHSPQTAGPSGSTTAGGPVPQAGSALPTAQGAATSALTKPHGEGAGGGRETGSRGTSSSAPLWWRKVLLLVVAMRSWAEDVPCAWGLDMSQLTLLLAAFALCNALSLGCMAALVAGSLGGRSWARWVGMIVMNLRVRVAVCLAHQGSLHEASFRHTIPWIHASMRAGRCCGARWWSPASLPAWPTSMAAGWAGTTCCPPSQAVVTRGVLLRVRVQQQLRQQVRHGRLSCYGWA